MQFTPKHFFPIMKNTYEALLKDHTIRLLTPVNK